MAGCLDQRFIYIITNQCIMLKAPRFGSRVTNFVTLDPNFVTHDPNFASYGPKFGPWGSNLAPLDPNVGSIDRNAVPLIRNVLWNLLKAPSKQPAVEA